MSTLPGQSDKLAQFKNEYDQILKNYLKAGDISENLVTDGYQLGRTAVSQHLDILIVVAIHQDSLGACLENLETSNHQEVAQKASVFLKEVLSCYQRDEYDKKKNFSSR